MRLNQHFSQRALFAQSSITSGFQHALFAGLCCILAPASAGAQARDGAWGVYGQIGNSARGTDSANNLGLGAMAPLMARHEFWNGSLTAYWDFNRSRWRGPAATGGPSFSYSQIGIQPTLRYRWDDGQTPWFADAALGMTYLDDTYRRPNTHFSTRFNFAEGLAVGRSLGANAEHEIELRLQHVSNGSIRHPNPGENFVLLRFMARF